MCRQNLLIVCTIFWCLLASLICKLKPVVAIQNDNPRDDNVFPVSIIHINDFHARYEETDDKSSSCGTGQKCIGGYARMTTVIKELLDKRKLTNPVFLNAGDNFQGTLWYNIFRWNVTSTFLNKLPADAITLGNHEFDHAIAGVVPFMDAITSPIVVANLDDRDEPTFQNKYNKSIVIERNGRKIGIIGVMLQTTNLIANTGKLKFLDEPEAVRLEADSLKAQGVNIVIVLSHSGLDVDRRIAANGGPNIDVIVGGHTHSFLFSGATPPGPDKPVDKYPVEIMQSSPTHKVLIVQASAYAKYVGDLTVRFDAAGEIIDFEGQPIFLDNSVREDAAMLAALAPWKREVDAIGLKQVGTSRTDLMRNNCGGNECNLGNLIADSFVEAFVELAEGDDWTYAAAAINGVGGIRTGMSKGILTYGQLVTVLPFENTIDTMDFRGEDVLDILEFSVNVPATTTGRFSSQKMLQVSGIKVVYNVTNPVGSRVVSVHMLCSECVLPEFTPLVLNDTYRLIMPSFMVGGGDGFAMIPLKGKNHRIGPIDIDAFSQYVEKMSPIMLGEDERITVLT